MTQARFHAGSTLFASTGVDRVVRQWEGRSGLLVRELHGHRDVVLSMALVPHHQELLVTGGDDGLCILFGPDQQDL